MAHEHSTSLLATCLLIAGCLVIVIFQGWFAHTIVGDLGQPDWDYRPVKDVPGESAYTLTDPYHPLPFPQHVVAEQGAEQYELRILNLYETYKLAGDDK
jgi:hypothetical protein